MTEAQFTKAWMEVSKNYNSIGSVLDMLAVTALYDAYDAIVETPLYRHIVKKRLNMCVAAARQYEKRTQQAYYEKYALWADYNMAMQEQLEAKVFILYNTIHRFLSKRKMPHLTECSLAFKALVLACNAKDFHDEFFDEIEKRTHIKKFRQLYSYASMDGICTWMQGVCHCLTNNSEDIVMQFNTDADISLALTAINNHLHVEDHLNDAAKTACSMDMEQYGDALRELEAEDERKRAAQEAEKAAADKVAAEMAREAESARNEAVALRLGEKYTVKRGAC